MTPHSYLDDRRTFAAFLTDYVGYGIAMAAISMTTYLPMFLKSQTDSNVVIGLIPATFALARSFTCMLAAPYLERKRFIRIWMIVAMVVERTPLILCGVWIFFSRACSPGLVVAGVLILWTLYNLGNGLASTAWGSYFARVLSPQKRGRLNGWGISISALCGLAVVPAVEWLIESFGLPRGYGMAMSGGGLLLVAGSLIFLLGREAPFVEVKQRTDWRGYMREMVPILRSDARFRWFIVAACLWLISYTGFSYFTVYAIQQFGAGPNTVMWYTISMAAGSGFTGYICGQVAGKRGYTVVLLFGFGATIASMVAVFFTRQGEWMYPAFALAGCAMSASYISIINLPMELAQRQHVPTYVAVSAFVRGPVGTLAPLAAGIYLEFFDFTPLFLFCAFTGIVGAYLLNHFVREPRNAASDLPAKASVAGRERG